MTGNIDNKSKLNYSISPFATRTFREIKSGIASTFIQDLTSRKIFFNLLALVLKFQFLLGWLAAYLELQRTCFRINETMYSDFDTDLEVETKCFYCFKGFEALRSFNVYCLVSSSRLSTLFHYLVTSSPVL